MNMDTRPLEGKTCIFDTHGNDSELKIHDGKKCVVKKRKPINEYDYFDIGTMWEICLEDGTQVDAFPDELEETEEN